MIDKLVAYMLQIRRLSRQFNYDPSSIIAMDETAVWADMVSPNTVDITGTKYIPLKTTGNEKVRVSVCLTAKADGTKLKPFIVFGGAKRESKALNDEFKARCCVASSANAWMNEELTIQFVNSVTGKFAFRRRLLAWNSFECHTTNEVRKTLKMAKVDSVIVPGGCTKYILFTFSMKITMKMIWMLNLSLEFLSFFVYDPLVLPSLMNNKYFKPIYVTLKICL